MKKSVGLVILVLGWTSYTGIEMVWQALQENLFVSMEKKLSITFSFNNAQLQLHSFLHTKKFT